jgi:hypothetical protein
MAGIAAIAIIIFVLVLVYLIGAAVTFFEGRTDNQDYDCYDNSHHLWLAWAYDAGYTSKWRKVDVEQRNQEKFAERAKKDGRMK